MADIFNTTGIPANSFGGTMNPYVGQNNQMNGRMQPNNIPVYPMQAKEGAEQYPIPNGTTALFMNYNGRKFWLKTQHQNGLSYDLQEMIFFTPEELVQFQNQIRSSAAQQAQQNQQEQASAPVDYVKREEFDALKKAFEEFIK